jgi:hypothetical protein
VPILNNADGWCGAPGRTSQPEEPAYFPSDPPLSPDGHGQGIKTVKTRIFPSGILGPDGGSVGKKMFGHFRVQYNFPFLRKGPFTSTIRDISFFPRQPHAYTNASDPGLTFTAPSPPAYIATTATVLIASKRK